MHENMHRICGSLVNKRWRGWIIYCSQSLRVELKGYTVINRYSNTSMSYLNFFKLCKILADHDQCIQWCKEHNLLAPSKKCPRENCSNTLTWTRRTSSRDEYDQDTGAHTQHNENTWWAVKRSMPRTGTSKDLFESYLQQWLWRQHYGDDPFAKTLSSISLTYMKYAKMKNIVSRSYHCIYCSWCDRHVMEERAKIHIFNTWDWIGGRKSRGKTAKDTIKVSNSFISLQFSFKLIKIEK